MLTFVVLSTIFLALVVAPLCAKDRRPISSGFKLYR
jgi:hypothetical protein